MPLWDGISESISGSFVCVFCRSFPPSTVRGGGFFNAVLSEVY